MDKSKLLLKVLPKIPVFHSLPPSRVRRMVGLCESRRLAENEILCRHDTPSDELYILLSGELAVVTDRGLRVATLTPVTTVGEVGVITGQPRSATVTAARDSRILVLGQRDFESVFQDDPGLQARVLRNFIQLLADRVSDDNLRLRDYQLELQRFEGVAAGLEQQARQAGARVDALLQLIAGNSDMPLEQARADVEAAAATQAPRVLVVDDEADFRQLVGQSLEPLQVLEADGGEQALEAVERDPPDLVVTDIMMPGMDGMELASRIHAQRPGLPVVAVSGFVDESDVDGQGFAGFMGKPLRMRDFRALVERALDSGQAAN